jgi:glycerophosphoryl diester phosphodiesterase
MRYRLQLIYAAIAAVAVPLPLLYLLLPLAGLSALLLRCPWLLWSVNPTRKRLSSVRTFAHRGGRDTTAENTLESFRNAHAHTDAIELDVWSTKCGQVVVFHDPDLMRMCGDARKVVDCTFDELPSIQLPTPDSDPWSHGHTHSLRDKEKTEGSKKGGESMRIPLLSDVLSALPKDRWVLIEFKQHSPELVAKVDTLVKELGVDERTLWFSLLRPINDLLKAHNPTRPRVMSIAEITRTILLYHTGLLPLCSLTSPVFGIVAERISDGLLRKVPGLASVSDATLDRCKGVIQAILLDPRLVRHLEGRGTPTGCNTLVTHLQHTCNTHVTRL